MNCDLCGNESELLKAFIEGTELTVCQKCSRHGRIVGKAYNKPQQKAQELKSVTGPVHAVNPNFAKLIKNAREKLNLKQEGLAKAISEKESIIHKVETGSVVPNPALAKKLESFLKIRLIEEFREEVDKQQKPRSAELTLGDFIKVRKK